MKIKKIIALILALTLSFALVACGGGSDTPTPAPAPADNSGGDTAPADSAPEDSAPAAGGSDVNIEVFLMCNDFHEGALDMVRVFNETYEGVFAELTQLITPTTAEAIQPRAAAGALPEVMSIDADTFGSRLADEGLLVDLNNYPEIVANVIPDLIGPYTSPSGVFYGVAGGLATSFIYVNENKFAEAGITDDDIPSNWDEFLALCSKIKDAGIPPLITPANVGYSQMPNTFWTAGMATHFLAQGVDYGAQIKAGTFNFDTPEYALVYGRPLELLDKEYFINGILSFQYTEANDAWLQGEAAMLFGGSWLAGPLFADADFPIKIIMPTLNEPGNNPGVALGVETGFAAANNENAEWGVKFVDFMTNGEGFYVYQNVRANLPYIVNYDAARIVQEEPVAEYMDAMFANPNVAMGPFWFMILPAETFGAMPVVFSQVLSYEITPEEGAKLFNEEFQAAQ